MSKKSVNLIYKFNGNIESIDLFEIAPILLSLGQIIQDSNKIIYPNSSELGINAKPFENGSFIIEIVLFAKTNLQNMISFVNSSEGQRIKELLEFIGLSAGIVAIGNSGVKGLVGLIKYLKGKPPQKMEKINKNETKITTQDNKSITVNNHIINLYINPNIKNHIWNALGRPLEQNGIEVLESYLKEKEEETKINVNKETKEYIKSYSSSEQIEPEDKNIIEELYISPKRGSFSGESNSWSFRRSTNNEIITVSIISDNEFLEKCKKGIIKPFEKDMLKVKLKTTYNPETMKPRKIEIVQVLEYLPFEDKQFKMFDDK